MYLSKNSNYSVRILSGIRGISTSHSVCKDTKTPLLKVFQNALGSKFHQANRNSPANLQRSFKNPQKSVMQDIQEKKNLAKPCGSSPLMDQYKKKVSSNNHSSEQASDKKFELMNVDFLPLDSQSNRFAGVVMTSNIVEYTPADFVKLYTVINSSTASNYVFIPTTSGVVLVELDQSLRPDLISFNDVNKQIFSNSYAEFQKNSISSSTKTVSEL
jgi:hypothetical protein